MTGLLDQAIEKLRALSPDQKDAAADVIMALVETDLADVQAWQDAGVREALAALDRGDGLPHEEIKAWAIAEIGKSASRI